MAKKVVVLPVLGAGFIYLVLNFFSIMISTQSLLNIYTFIAALTLFTFLIFAAALVIHTFFRQRFKLSLAFIFVTAAMFSFCLFGSNIVVVIDAISEVSKLDTWINPVFVPLVLQLNAYILLLLGAEITFICLAAFYGVSKKEKPSEVEGSTN